MKATKLILAAVLFLLSAGISEAQRRLIQGDSGVLSAASTSSPVGTIGTSAAILLDFTLLTLPDSDDEVDFYIQTTYDGINWTDVENIHFTDADDGTTAQRVVIIDGQADGPGVLQASEGTDPATGTEVSETVPANTVWRLLSLEVALLTDGTGTPRIYLLIDNGNFVHYRAPSTSTQPISVTEEYIFGPHGYGQASVDGTHVIPVPQGLLMSAGHRIRTTGIDANDSWGAPHWVVEAWHDYAVSTDGSIGDNLKSYHRPLGSQIRIKVTVTGATAPSYAYSATAIFR